MASALSRDALYTGRSEPLVVFPSARKPQNLQPTTTMIKYIVTILATLALASCEGLTVDLNNDQFQGSYSAKGGLVIAPQAIRIIEPSK
jgi:hypothetical protein